MEIGLILAHRYPAEPMPPVNYEVRADVEGNLFISYWDAAVLGPQPTDTQLRSWWIEAEKWNIRKQLAAIADAEYDAMLAPDGAFSRVERDETLEKKAANKAVLGSANLVGVETTISSKVDTLRSKYKTKKQEVNVVTQQTGETVEQAVARVRAVAW